jgi:hypothetical protein
VNQGLGVKAQESDMVFRQTKYGGWHEPPYTKEEEMDFYRRMNPKPGTPMTIYRGQRKPAERQAQQQQPQPKET